MSVSSGARRDSSDGQRITDSLLRNEQDFVQRMKPFNSSAPGQGPSTSGEMTGSNPLNIGMAVMANVGAQIDGAIAYLQNDLPKDVANAIKVGRGVVDGVFTSFGNLIGAVNDDILDIIDGGDFDGQVLKLLIPDGVSNYTINNRNKTGNDTGNIFIAGVDNLIAQGGEVLEFIFDTTTAEPTMARVVTGIPGVWRLSSGTGAGGDPATVILGRDEDQPLGNATDVIDYNDNFFFGNQEKITSTLTPGVFKLLAGFVYNAEATMALELSVAGQGTSCLGAWEYSFAEGGPFTKILAGVVEEEAQILGVFNGARGGFTTQPNIVTVIIDARDQDVYIRNVIDVVIGTTIQYFNAGSGAVIETVGLGGGSSGGGGSGGATSLDELSDVTITSPQNNDHLIYNSTAAQWENQVAGVASQTPWLSDIDAAGFSLDNLLSLQIDDSAGAVKLSISGPLGVGARFAYLPGDSVFFTSNIVDKVEINDSGLSLLTNDLTMGTGGQIFAGGDGQGMSNIGVLEFVTTNLSPSATFAIYTDGTDLLANTGSHVTNLDDIPQLSDDNTWTGTNTFNENIVAAGSLLGMSNIGVLSFVESLGSVITPLSIWSDGSKFLLNANVDYNLKGQEKVSITQYVTPGGTVKGSISGDVGAGVLLSTGLNELFTIQQVLTPIATFSTIAGDEVNFFGDVDMQKNFLFEVGSVVFDAFNVSGDGKSITGSSGLMNFTMEDQTDLYRFNFFTGISNIRALEISQNTITLRSAQEDTTIAAFNALTGIDFLETLNMNDNAVVDVAQLIQGNDYHERIAMANPGAPDTATKGRVFMDSNNSNHLSIVRQSGLVDLEASAGGSQTPWVSDIDADGHNLEDFGILVFRNTILGLNTESYISRASSNININAPTGEGIVQSVNNIQKFGVGSSLVNCFTGLSMNANRITSVGPPVGGLDAANKDYVDSQATTLEGTIEEALWTDGETIQFDFFVWHSNSNNAGDESGSVSMLENILYYIPFFVGKSVNVFRLGIKVTAAASSYNLSGGVYSNRTDGQNYPATLLANASQFHTGAGFKTVLIGTAALTPGLYWLAFNFTSGPSQITIDGYPRGDCISIGWKENGNDLDPMTGYFQGHSSPTLPTTPDDEMGIVFDLTPLHTNAHYVRFTP